MQNCSRWPYPLLRGGVAAPYKQMSRYLEQGAAGEVRNMFQQGFDLPRRAEAKVAWHLLDRRANPSSKEGIWPYLSFVQFTHTFCDRRYSLQHANECYAASRMFILTFSFISGVICRIPCCFACSSAFCIRSASLVPRITCWQPLDGSTFAHSTILAMIVPFVGVGVLNRVSSRGFQTESS